jgi:hypothetical protein
MIAQEDQYRSMDPELRNAVGSNSDLDSDSATESRSDSEQLNPRSSYKQEAIRILAPPDRSSGKRDRIRLFKTLAARCSVSAKSKYRDMQDCYSASAAIADVLHARGYTDARSVGCSVVVADHTGPVKIVGDVKVREKASHAVVIASGCLIDATAGQFRSTGLSFPDYLIFHSRDVLQVLQLNRDSLGRKGNIEVNYFKVAPGVLIGYIPTDPGFSAK